MTARVRKFIGGIGVVIFLIAYAGLVVTIADYIPKAPLAQLAFFVAAGLLWGVPILPLLTWMNRGR
ncbi:MAG: DUF2842 domain-containing protein [Caulobacteraceae bacterium]